LESGVGGGTGGTETVGGVGVAASEGVIAGPTEGGAAGEYTGALGPGMGVAGAAVGAFALSTLGNGVVTASTG
jgi:hypothetical protein